MAEIPTEALIYVGLAFLSAITALTLTNTWQGVKTRTCLHGIERRLGIAEDSLDKGKNKFAELDKRTEILETKEEIFHASAVHPPG